MIARLLALAALLLSARLTAAEPAELTGVWKIASLESEEGVIDLPASPHLLQIKGGKLIYGREAVADLVADSTTKPKVIDLWFAEDDAVHEGIYLLEKDALKICLNGQTDGIKERPDSFALADHPARRLLTFVRVSDDDAGPGRGFIGVALRFDKNLSVVVVQSILENTPAQKAGLLEGDQLVAVDGVAVTDLVTSIETMRKATPGSKLRLKIRRDDAEREITLPVALFPFRLLVGLR